MKHQCRVEQKDLKGYNLWFEGREGGCLSLLFVVVVVVVVV